MNCSQKFKTLSVTERIKNEMFLSVMPKQIILICMSLTMELYNQTAETSSHNHYGDLNYPVNISCFFGGGEQTWLKP